MTVPLNVSVSGSVSCPNTWSNCSSVATASKLVLGPVTNMDFKRFLHFRATVQVLEIFQDGSFSLKRGQSLPLEILFALDEGCNNASLLCGVRRIRGKLNVLWFHRDAHDGLIVIPEGSLVGKENFGNGAHGEALHELVTLRGQGWIVDNGRRHGRRARHNNTLGSVSRALEGTSSGQLAIERQIDHILIDKNLVTADFVSQQERNLPGTSVDPDERLPVLLPLPIRRGRQNPRA